LQQRLLAIALARAKRGQHAQRGQTLALVRAQHRHAVKQRAASGLAKQHRLRAIALSCAPGSCRRSGSSAASSANGLAQRSHVLICASARAASGHVKQHARSHVLICASGRTAKRNARSSRRAAHRSVLNLRHRLARRRGLARRGYLRRQ
jgi:hypothetical protein